MSVKNKEIKEIVIKEGYDDCSYFEKEFWLYWIIIKQVQINSWHLWKKCTLTHSDKGLDNWEDALATKDVPLLKENLIIPLKLFLA